MGKFIKPISKKINKKKQFMLVKLSKNKNQTIYVKNALSPELYNKEYAK